MDYGFSHTVREAVYTASVEPIARILPKLVQAIEMIIFVWPWPVLTLLHCNRVKGQGKAKSFSPIYHLYLMHTSPILVSPYPLCTSHFRIQADSVLGDAWICSLEPYGEHWKLKFHLPLTCTMMSTWSLPAGFSTVSV